MLVDEIRALKPKSKKEDIISKMRDIAKEGRSYIVSSTLELTKEDCKWFCSEGFKVYIDNPSEDDYSLILIYWGDNDDEELKIIEYYTFNGLFKSIKEFKE